MFSVPSSFAVNVVAELVPGAAIPLVDANVACLVAIPIVVMGPNGNDASVG